MKVVISTSNDSLDSLFDPRFGRAAYYCILDSESGAWAAFSNQAVNATGGAGVQASQFIVEKGAQVAISGDFGPNAYMTLAAAGIRMFVAPAGETLTGRELFDRYQAGELEELSAPSHGGHHGRGR